MQKRHKEKKTFEENMSFSFKVSFSDWKTYIKTDNWVLSDSTSTDPYMAVPVSKNFSQSCLI